MSLNLEQQVRETSALLRVKKGQVAAQVRAGVEIATSELLAISKLEMRLANLESYVRLADMTREAVVDEGTEVARAEAEAG